MSLHAGSPEGVTAGADVGLRNVLLHIFVAPGARLSSTRGAVRLVAVQASLPMLCDPMHIRQPTDRVAGAAPRRRSHTPGPVSPMAGLAAQLVSTVGRRGLDLVAPCTGRGRFDQRPTMGIVASPALSMPLGGALVLLGVTSGAGGGFSVGAMM